MQTDRGFRFPPHSGTLFGFLIAMMPTLNSTSPGSTFCWSRSYCTRISRPPPLHNNYIIMVLGNRRHIPEAVKDTIVIRALAKALRMPGNINFGGLVQSSSFSARVDLEPFRICRWHIDGKFANGKIQWRGKSYDRFRVRDNIHGIPFELQRSHSETGRSCSGRMVETRFSNQFVAYLASAKLRLTRK